VKVERLNGLSDGFVLVVQIDNEGGIRVNVESGVVVLVKGFVEP
jgi:hypothetical protein